MTTCLFINIISSLFLHGQKNSIKLNILICVIFAYLFLFYAFVVHFFFLTLSLQISFKLRFVFPVMTVFHETKNIVKKEIVDDFSLFSVDNVDKSVYNPAIGCFFCVYYSGFFS